MAKAAEVASHSVRPWRSGAIQSPSGTRTPEGGAVPGKHDIAGGIDYGKIGQLAVVGLKHAHVLEPELGDDVGHPAPPEALPSQHVDPARAQQRP